MRKGKAFIHVAITILLLLTLFPAESLAQGNSEIIKINRQKIVFSLDGKAYESPTLQQSFIYNDRTYVSIRFASDMLEKWIEWDGKTRSVIITDPTKEQLKKLKELKQTYLQKDAQDNATVRPVMQNVQVSSNFGTIFVNGEKKNLPSDVTTVFFGDTIFVPLRYFGELFENEVDFDPKTYTVIVNSSFYLDEQKVVKKEPGAIVVNPEIPIVPVVPNSGQAPTKATLVTQTTSELSSYKSALTGKANDLFAQYQRETDKTKKEQLESQAISLMTEADSKVEEIISKLEKDASSNHLKLDGEAEKLRADYVRLKGEMIDQIFNKL